MIRRSIARLRLLPILGLVVAACSTSVPSTPSAAVATPADTAPRATFAPPPTPEPTVDPQPLPTTTTTGWWGEQNDPRDCMPIGYYQVNLAYQLFGNCYGTLPEGPREVTLDVGQNMDIHMVVVATGAQPIYPLPEPEDDLIVRGWLIYDDATLTYQALSPGTTRLVTTGSCVLGTTLEGNPPVPPAGECIVLVVHVRPIERSCIDLAEDVCHAVGAAAVFHAITEPGQRIVGWVARPSKTHIEWTGCGTTFAEVTFTLADPEVEWTVSMGRIEPELSGKVRYLWCTY